jgi:hypothetical protein
VAFTLPALLDGIESSWLTDSAAILRRVPQPVRAVRFNSSIGLDGIFCDTIAE